MYLIFSFYLCVWPALWEIEALARKAKFGKFGPLSAVNCSENDQTGIGSFLAVSMPIVVIKKSCYNFTVRI